MDKKQESDKEKTLAKAGQKDTRTALFPKELPDEIKEELERGYQGGPTPDIDHLLD